MVYRFQAQRYSTARCGLTLFSFNSLFAPFQFVNKRDKDFPDECPIDKCRKAHVANLFTACEQVM
jgi:hypothetical protein